MEIRRDDSKRRFVAETGGQPAHLFYAMAGPETMNIVSTFVPPEARGAGIGQQLVEAAVAYAKKRDWEVVATCSFARRVLSGRP